MFNKRTIYFVFLVWCILSTAIKASDSARLALSLRHLAAKAFIEKIRQCHSTLDQKTLLQSIPKYVRMDILVAHRLTPDFETNQLSLPIELEAYIPYFQRCPLAFVQPALECLLSASKPHSYAACVLRKRDEALAVNCKLEKRLAVCFILDIHQVVLSVLDIIQARSAYLSAFNEDKYYSCGLTLLQVAVLAQRFDLVKSLLEEGAVPDRAIDIHIHLPVDGILLQGFAYHDLQNCPTIQAAILLCNREIVRLLFEHKKLDINWRYPRKTPESNSDEGVQDNRIYSCTRYLALCYGIDCVFDILFSPEELKGSYTEECCSQAGDPSNVVVPAVMMMGENMHRRQGVALDLIRRYDLDAGNTEMCNTAVRWQNYEVVNELIRREARAASPPNTTGMLHVAAKYQKDVRVVQLLLKHGADPCARDSAGEVPFLLARQAGNEDIADRLLKAMYERRRKGFYD